MRTFSLMLVLVAGGSGCGWLSEREVSEWLAGATCDGGAMVENADGCVLHYADADADGYGGSEEACLCNPTEDYPVTVGGDCDDADPSVNPGAVEVCDEALRDEDCDPTTLSLTTLYYRDLDGDGVGTAASKSVCAPDDEYRALVTGDCDDADPTVYLRDEEDYIDACDGIDNDCNPDTTEEGVVTIEGGPSTADGLQAAVALAAPGDTLTICPGTYDGIEVSKSLRLRGLEDAGTVIVDGAGRGPAVLVTGEEVELEHLTLTGGTGRELGSGVFAGGGLYVTGGGAVFGHDIVVTGNRVDGQGGGIYAAGSVVLSEALVFDNSATADGGGIYASGGPVELQDTNLFYNQAGRGAGLYLHDTDLDLDNARISGNFGDTGGGVYVDGGSVITALGTGGGISSNSATVLGAGIAITAPDEVVELVGVSLSDNVAPERGGGAAITRGTLVSTGSHWVGTTADDCSQANYQDDVYVGGESWCAGDNATFTCTEAGCDEAGDISADCSCPAP